MYADCGIKIGVGRARTPAVPRGGLASRGLLRVCCARGSSPRRLIETRRELTEPFDDKTADQAAPLWRAALAKAHLCSGVVDKLEPARK